MTANLDIEKLRELLGKATQAPWRKSTGNLGNGIEGPTGKLLFEGDDGYRTVATYQACTASPLHKDQEANANANCDLIIELRNAIGPLLDRVEKMEANARRYEWLRDKQAYVAVDPHYRELPFNERTGWTIRLVTGDDTSFDAAIDAALRGKGE